MLDLNHPNTLYDIITKPIVDYYFLAFVPDDYIIIWETWDMLWIHITPELYIFYEGEIAFDLKR